MFLTILLLIIGLVALVKGADIMVDGSSALAKKYRVSNLVIGLTIVAFGTSAPELIVNSIAAYELHPEIVFGNIIGSNLFNLLAILGIAGLITPLAVQTSSVRYEIPMSLFAVALVAVLANDQWFSASAVNQLDLTDALILLLGFALFLFYIFRQMKKEQVIQIETSIMSESKMTLFIFLGLAGLIIGGKLIVDSAVEIATVLGIGEKTIGLTIVAAGTSLPELVTSVVAARKGKADIAVGNIIGSNLFNLLLILGVSSSIHSNSYVTIMNIDLLVLAGGTIFLIMAMFIGKRHRLDRWQAAVFLIGFFGYMIYVLDRA